MSGNKQKTLKKDALGGSSSLVHTIAAIVLVLIILFSLPKLVGAQDEGSSVEGLGEDGSQEQAQEGFGEFMSSFESQLTDMMKKSAKAPSDAWEHFQAFSSAVNWKEGWIRGLMVFHVVNFVFFLITRKWINTQTLHFLAICVLVRCSEYINSYCAIHWRRFSSQDYFDKHGVFTSLLFSAPLLTLGLLQLLNFLSLASSALITAKRLELRGSKRASTEAKMQEEKSS